MRDDHPTGTGERLVELLCCLEHATDRVEHVLPSVDHLALTHEVPDPDSVLAGLRRNGPADLVQLFEAWCGALDEFYSSVTDLKRMRNGAPLGPHEYQETLDRLIHVARHRREHVEETAKVLRRAVAHVIDAVAAVPVAGAVAARHP